MKKFIIGFIVALALFNPVFAENPSQNLSATTKNNISDVEKIMKEANSYLVNDKTKSMELYKKALTIDPNNSEANYYVGVLYLMDNEPEESLSYLINSIKYDPKNALAYSAIAVNCDMLGYYDLTTKYIEQYKKEFPPTEITNDLAKKFEETSKAKKEYAQKVISTMNPLVEISLPAPKWQRGYKIEKPHLIQSQLIVNGHKVNDTPEALTFTKFSGINNYIFSSTDFAHKYYESIKTQNPDFTLNIIKNSQKNYSIFEIEGNNKYELFKCVLGKNSAYLMQYTLKPNKISKIKKQYWIDMFEKANFVNIE